MHACKKSLKQKEIEHRQTLVYICWLITVDLPLHGLRALTNIHPSTKTATVGRVSHRSNDDPVRGCLPLPLGTVNPFRQQALCCHIYSRKHLQGRHHTKAVLGLTVTRMWLWASADIVIVAFPEKASYQRPPNNNHTKCRNC